MLFDHSFHPTIIVLLNRLTAGRRLLMVENSIRVNLSIADEDASQTWKTSIRPQWTVYQTLESSKEYPKIIQDQVSSEGDIR